MVKTACEEDCGNSPKKRLLRDFNFAVAKGGLRFVKKCLAEDAVWNLFEPSGQKRLAGRDDIILEYERNLAISPAQFAIRTIITHGNTGAVEGTIKAKGGKSYVFCDIYRFSSHAKDAKIREMSSYIIEIWMK
ncbi:MAG: nuclear transport factor 2 family protein [Candidatus Micrarchaeota archaeon]